MDSGDIRTKLQELQFQQHQKLVQRMKTKNVDKTSENVQVMKIYLLVRELPLSCVTVSEKWHLMQELIY